MHSMLPDNQVDILIFEELAISFLQKMSCILREYWVEKQS